MVKSHIPLHADCPLDDFDGSLGLTGLKGNYAQKMERVGLVRLGGENLPIDLFGSLQSAALLVLDRNCKCFGDCRHSAD